MQISPLRLWISTRNRVRTAMWGGLNRGYEHSWVVEKHHKDGHGHACINI